MGLLTDVLVASPSEAEAICADLRHFENWPCWQSKGVDNLVFSDLLRALGFDADAKALRGEGRLIYLKDKGGPWVFHLPDVLPIFLAKLQDDEIPVLAERWLQGEEAGDGGALVEDIALALTELRTLSKQAVLANKTLLLWMCS
jgi:hypothetical protein